MKSTLAILHSAKSSGSPELDEGVWKKTQEAVEKGWVSKLTGLPDDDDDGRVSRRFGVSQSGKIRPVGRQLQ